MRPVVVATVASLSIGIGSAEPTGATNPRPETINSLLDKEAITDAWGRYVVLLEGDMISPADPNKWADALFTDSASFEAVGPKGEQILNIKGRAALAKAFGAPRNPGFIIDSAYSAGTGIKVSREIPLNISFDQLTPTRATTRTNVVALILQTGDVNIGSHSPVMMVFHDKWIKTAAGWKKAESIVHFLTDPAAPEAEEKLDRPSTQLNGAFGGPGRLNKHYSSPSIVYDEISSSAARSRALVTIAKGQKNGVKPDLAASSESILWWHDDWMRGADGVWRKSKSDLHYVGGRRPAGGDSINASNPPSRAPDRTVVAKELSQEGVLEIKQALRDKLAEYTLLLDGDETAQCGSDSWAVSLFTEGATFTQIQPGGRTRPGANQNAVGREQIGRNYSSGTEPFPKCATSASSAIGPELTGLQKLIIKEQIRQKIAESNFLESGDGVRGQNLQAWADSTFTPDAVFQSYGDGGAPLLGSQPLTGRESIAKVMLKSSGDNEALVERWYYSNIFFDEVSRDSVRTRTVAFFAKGPRQVGQLPNPTMSTEAVFFDTWKRNADGWKIEKREVR